jgi:hypothetical protein
MWTSANKVRIIQTNFTPVHLESELKSQLIEPILKYLQCHGQIFFL